MDFALSTYYNAFDVDNEYSLNPESVEPRLAAVTDALAHSPDALLHNSDLFEESLDLVHGYKLLSEKHAKQLSYLYVSSFLNACQHTQMVVEAGDFVDQLDSLKGVLERYGYLLYVLLNFLSKEEFPAGKKAHSSQKWRNNCLQVEEALDATARCFQINLLLIFVTTPEKSQFLDLFVRPIFHLMELPERVKVANAKILMFRCVALAATRHGHAALVQNLIIQALTYYIHLPPYIAELMHMLNVQFEHAAMTEELIRGLSQLEFSNSDTNGPKAVSEFLVKLSELCPRLILKQMSAVAQLLDNLNMTLRCSVVETCGNIVTDILKQQDLDEHGNQAQQVDGLLNLLEERFLDQNPFVRTKAIQAVVKVCSLPVRIPRRRQSAMLQAVRSLADKSTLVRRNAIKLMYKLLLTHPFTSQGTQLKLSEWETKLAEADKELEKYMPLLPNQDDMDVDPEESQSGSLGESLDESLDEPLEIEAERAPKGLQEVSGALERIPDTEVLIKAKLTQQYYADAVEFIRAIHEGTKTALTLLFSKNRNEVLELMDFLVLADTYGIEIAAQGIRRMLHLVWMKGSSDEGKSISSHLIECYKDLFLTAPSSANMTQAAVIYAKNLIGLTFDALEADLASLEKLLCLMYEERLINKEVKRVLWHIYTRAGEPESEFSAAQIHGASIILGMLSLADSGVVQAGLDLLLRIGLGDVGKRDLDLCKQSCSMLLKIALGDYNHAESVKFPQEAEAMECLKSVLVLDSDKTEWFGVAEQAVAAIFRASSKPEDVCADIIKTKSAAVFESNSVSGLSQLLYIVGHIAIKTIQYLEQLETQFKKRKHDAESKDKDDEAEADNELEMIGGTTEDDFTDVVVHIKERELLYGDNALLAPYAKIAKEVCSNQKLYQSVLLQRSATLCLSKLMCVSSKFCEDNLPLFITIMEKSADPIIRSNCVLGLGDMAVCFNNLVDENTDFLYRRLTDENLMVQRTCLMTITFLILAGQVKVKGQLSAMAKCLENPDQGISDMCRLFFTELATKDNAIYNQFIDIFSGLSNDNTLRKESMRLIIKFLVGFIDKEKHQKQLADKLLKRLGKCQTQEQWQDVAFTLGAIAYKNDEITLALEAGFTIVAARE